MNNSTTIVDTDFEQQNKEHQQQLKLNCLNSATNDEIVIAAKAFYAFVRT